MLEQRVPLAINATRAQVWTYVSEMANWASNMPGYRSFEVLSERESLWTLKIGFGSLVRTVKVRVQISVWQEPDRVDFTYQLDNDPVDGGGSFVANARSDGRTDVELSIRINGQGRLAPAWEAMGRPVLPKMVNGFADALKVRIEEIAGQSVAPAEAHQLIDTQLRQALDRVEIRGLIENWVLWRDAGDWERLRTLWHDDGRMVTTWCDVGVEEFIELCKRAWTNATVSTGHFLGGTSLEIARDRAVAQTKMRLAQRASLHGIEVDVTCIGRFYDLLERRNHRWALVLRHPIYEMDRIDSVDPSATLALDPALLREFPQGYRHLAYLQAGLGLTVNRKLPGRSGPELTQLYARGRAWLADSGADIVG